MSSQVSFCTATDLASALRGTRLKYIIRRLVAARFHSRPLRLFQPRSESLTYFLAVVGASRVITRWQILGKFLIHQAILELEGHLSRG